MPNDHLLQALLDNMRENNQDPEAFDRHEEQRNQHARPYDHPANVYVPPQKLNPDGSLADKDVDAGPDAGESAPPAPKPPKPEPMPAAVREGAEPGDVWVNVPDDIMDLLGDE